MTATHQIRTRAASVPTGRQALWTGRDFLRWLKKEKLSKARNLPNRQLLHAYQIDFMHPQTNQLICLLASDEKMLLHLSAEEEPATNHLEVYVECS